MSASDGANPIRLRIETAAILEHAQYSGVGQYVHQLSKQFLGRDDCQVELFSGPFYHSTTLDDRPGSAQTVLNKVYRKLASYGLPLPSDIGSPSDLSIYPNFAVLPTVRAKVKAAVIHDLTYLLYPEMMEQKNLDYLKRVVPKAINHSDFLVTVSETTKNALVDKFGIDPECCIVTPIPPSQAFLSASEIPDTAREKYGIPSKPYILFLGNIEPRKNLSLLIRAYLQLDSALREAHPLIIAGAAGWNSTDTGNEIERARKGGATIITPGYIDEVDKPGLFRSASLFVFPSLYEGFGMPLVEAMATETPVVLSDIPVLRETGKDFARYCDPTDSKSLAAAITDALSNQTNQHVEGAKNYVQSLSWVDNTDKIIAMYQKLRP